VVLCPCLLLSFSLGNAAVVQVTKLQDAVRKKETKCSGFHH